MLSFLVSLLVEGGEFGFDKTDDQFYGLGKAVVMTRAGSSGSDDDGSVSD